MSNAYVVQEHPGDPGTHAVAIGPHPNPHAEWRYDRGSTGRIARLCGEGLRPTWINLFEDERDWTDEEAAARAEAIWFPDRVLLLLGRQVCAAFGHPRAPWLSLLGWKTGSVLTVPHPSGLNRWWNDSSNYRRAAFWLRAAADGSLL